MQAGRTIERTLYISIYTYTCGSRYESFGIGVEMKLFFFLFFLERLPEAHERQEAAQLAAQGLMH